MANRKKLPVGIENFEDIRKQGFYYVDKTKLIEQLLDNWGKVNLFTRPRRFGKTLNMSMLKYFFEIGTDETLFDGLSIASRRDICEEHMGKYPVIFLSLKGVDGLTFETAKSNLILLVGREADKFDFLQSSEKLSANEKERYKALTSYQNGEYVMSEATINVALQTLSELLFKHFGRKTIILIDEYDVPLDKAFQHGYYKEMVSLIRGVFGEALKTNDYLQFAVLTGCLRVSKESIFTGINNFNVYAIDNVWYDEEFGFTDEEVQKLLEYYGFQDHFTEVKEWYDGYHFGNADIYCPWDVISYTFDLVGNPKAKPKTYWINSSGNDLVRRFIDEANTTTKDELECLIAGETVQKRIRMDLTYGEIFESIENIWSVLFTTGYLTQLGDHENGIYTLTIPNKEVREVFVLKVREWFHDVIESDSSRINRFCAAFPAGDVITIQDMLYNYLWDSISIRDTAVRIDRKENFYHGLVLGLLRSEGKWRIQSNEENGEGYSDITVRTPERVGMVIELKYANDGNLEAACKDALKQIEDKKYALGMQRGGMKKIICYGMAFYEKECMVLMD